MRATWRAVVGAKYCAVTPRAGEEDGKQTQESLDTRITAAAPVGDSPAAADVHAAHESAQGVMAAIDEFVGGSNEPWVPGVFVLSEGSIKALFRLYYGSGGGR